MAQKHGNKNQEAETGSADHLGYLLTAYLFDNLSPAGKAEVESHLAVCDDCRDQLDLLRATLGLTEQAFDDDGKTYVFEARRRQRILDAAARARHGFFDRLNPPALTFRSWKAMAAVAALLLMVVSVAFSAILGSAPKTAMLFEEKSAGNAPRGSQDDAVVMVTELKAAPEESSPAKEASIARLRTAAPSAEGENFRQSLNDESAGTAPKAALQSADFVATTTTVESKTPDPNDPRTRNFSWAEKKEPPAKPADTAGVSTSAFVANSTQTIRKTHIDTPVQWKSEPVDGTQGIRLPSVGLVIPDTKPAEPAAPPPPPAAAAFSAPQPTTTTVTPAPTDATKYRYIHAMPSGPGVGPKTPPARNLNVNAGDALGDLNAAGGGGVETIAGVPPDRGLDNLRGHPSLTPAPSRPVQFIENGQRPDTERNKLSVVPEFDGAGTRFGVEVGQPKREAKSVNVEGLAKLNEVRDQQLQGQTELATKRSALSVQSEQEFLEAKRKERSAAAVTEEKLDTLAREDSVTKLVEETEKKIEEYGLRGAVIEPAKKEIGKEVLVDLQERIAIRKLSDLEKKLEPAHLDALQDTDDAVVKEDGREKVAIAAKDDTIRRVEDRIAAERTAQEALAAQNDYLAVQNADASKNNAKQVQELSRELKEAYTQTYNGRFVAQSKQDGEKAAEQLSEQAAVRNPPRSKKARAANADSVVVPADVLDKAELGDHFETINPGKPDTQTAQKAANADDAPVKLGTELSLYYDGTVPVSGGLDLQRGKTPQSVTVKPEFEGRFYNRGRIEAGQTDERAAQKPPVGSVDFLSAFDGDIDNTVADQKAAETKGKVGGADGLMRAEGYYREVPTGGAVGAAATPQLQQGAAGNKITQTKLKDGGTVELKINDVQDLTGYVADFPGPELSSARLETKARSNLDANSDGEKTPSVHQRTYWNFTGKVPSTENNLEKMIKERFAEDFADPATSVDMAGGKLVIMNRPEVQQKIDAYLGELRKDPAGFQREWYAKEFSSPALMNNDASRGQAERTLRGFMALREDAGTGKSLSFAEFCKRPAPVAPPVLTDDGLDEDAYIEKYGTRPFVDAKRDHLSTFGMDVDTASYTRARSQLRDNNLPDPAAVRVEEFVNYFKQPYTVAGDEAFGVFAEAAPSPFNRADAPDLQLLKIGIKSRDPKPGERKPAMLTFAVDTSGSMTRDDRLDLLRAALGSLVEQLQPEDAVSIVAFSDQAQVVLPRTQARQKQRILDAVTALRPDGGTNVEAGLALAYRIADESFSPDAVNRVILCSDGVANVGAKGPEAVLKTVKVFAGRGIDLSSVGFGMGKYNDEMMMKLADNGNGSCHFVDNLDEARRIFTQQLPPNLSALARDAKVQVEFNTAVVSRYRLLGYEKRKIADKDFRNDAIDAGEVQHSTLVTALYEIERAPAARGALGKVFLRWKDSGHRHLPVIERNFPLDESTQAASADSASAQLRFLACVARFAELLRNSRWTRNSSYADVLEQMERLPADFKQSAEWKEVNELVKRAQTLSVQQWLKNL